MKLVVILTNKIFWHCMINVNIWKICLNQCTSYFPNVPCRMLQKSHKNKRSLLSARSHSIKGDPGWRADNGLVWRGRTEASGIEFNLLSWTYVFFVLLMVPKRISLCFLKGLWRLCKSQGGPLSKEYNYDCELLLHLELQMYLFRNQLLYINYKNKLIISHPSFVSLFTDLLYHFLSPGLSFLFILFLFLSSLTFHQLKFNKYFTLLPILALYLSMYSKSKFNSGVPFQPITSIKILPNRKKFRKSCYIN